MKLRIFSPVTAIVISALALTSCQTVSSQRSATPKSLKRDADARRGGLTLVYQNARALMNAGKHSEARREFARLDSGAFIIGDYAKYDLARMEMEDRRPAEALSVLDAMLEKYPETPLRAKANESRLRAACAQTGLESCGKYLELIGEADAPRDFAPERLFMEASQKLKESQPEDAHAVLMKLYLTWPASAAAARAKDAMASIENEAEENLRTKLAAPTIQQRMERAEKLKAAYKYAESAEEWETIIKSAREPYQRETALFRLGGVYNKGRERKKSIACYQKLLGEFPKSDYTAWAMYYIAAIEWNLDMGGEALAMASGILKHEPGGEPAKMALILMGKITDARGDFAAAKFNYSKALSMRLASAMDDELRWRVGWIEYRRGEFAEAARQFSDAAGKTPAFRQDGKFLYWAARAHSRAGEDDAAAASLENLVRKYPRSYYGALAEGFETDGATDMMDIAEAPGFSPAPPAQLDDEALRRYQRFEMLAQIGHMEGARMEAGAIGALAGGGSAETLWLASLYMRADAANQSIRLMSSYVFQDRHDDYADPYWKAVYPVSHWELIRGASESRGINPFTTLAIIRQESAFNPGALSPANARGLMQLIPSTGRAVYEKTAGDGAKNANFDPSSLFDPETNVTLGAAYFQELIARYNGNLPRAIAAYNAGAPAVDRWAARFGNLDDDEFVEMIPYPETREYVKKVMRNMTLYRRIYAHSGRAAPQEAGAGLKSAGKADEN